jgi:uncharacterized protein (DUF362 family)
MIRVGLARCPGRYGDLAAPFSPGQAYPEIRQLLGAEECSGPCSLPYAAVRSALHAAGLDADNFGSADWNPLADLVGPGQSVVVKPNFIRHWNPLAAETAGATVASVITHGSVVRAITDYAWLAVGRQGSVSIAEAPQQDCDFDEIRRLAGLEELIDFYRRSLGVELDVVDLRREFVRFRDGVIVERRALPGDPRGYRIVDLGEHSYFHGSDLDPRRFRGADYDPGPTSEQHMGGRNAYLLSETALSCDLLINLPKLKTHKKTGVTLALKNLVGINGDKNWLPHHSIGASGRGGDEFPGSSLLDRARSGLTEVGRQLLRRGIGTGLVRLYRRAETTVRGDAFIRAGNWYGNRTTWRMCLDLNRCVYYSDAHGVHLEAGSPVRVVLTVMDAIVAGEGNGPLAPRDVPLGAVIAGVDPVAVDLAALRLMGFAPEKVPKIWQAMQSDELRVTAVRSAEDVVVGLVQDGSSPSGPAALLPLQAIATAHPFEPHSGWSHHIEREQSLEDPAEPA